MKKIVALVLTLVLSVLAPISKVSATNTIDLSAYASETLEEAFTSDSISFDFTTSNYDESDVTNKTILYVFRKDGCSNCKNFLQFIASTLLPNYADKFVVKSFEVSQNPSNMNLVSRLAEFYGQKSTTGSYGTPIVIAGTTYSTGYVDPARQSEIESVIKSGDTFDPISAINQGTTSILSGSQKTFNDQQISFNSNTGLNNNFKLITAPINRQNVALNDYEYISAYDISLYNYTTKVALPNGQYTITIPVNKSYVFYRVAHIDNNGKIDEEFDAVAQNGNISFTTTHLSEYAVYGRNYEPAVSATQAAAKNKNLPANPNTSDPALIYSLVLASGIALLTISLIGYRKASKK